MICERLDANRLASSLLCVFSYYSAKMEKNRLLPDLPKHYATNAFKANHRSYSPSIPLHFDPNIIKIELFSKELEQNENSSETFGTPCSIV